MRQTLLTEYRKLVTTRMWWILLLCMAGYMIFLGAVMAFVLTGPDAQGAVSPGFGSSQPAPPLDAQTVARTIYTLAPSLGYVFPVIVGALSMTGEFRHMTVTPTFLAEPRRSRVLVAKLLAAVPLGVLFGLVGTASTVLGGAPVLALRHSQTFLGDASMLRTLALCVVALAVWGMVGVGFGAAIPNQVAAVVVLLAFTQFVEPIVRIGLTMSDRTAGIAKYLPGAAGEAITGSSFYASSGLGELLPAALGLTVLLGYGLLLAAVGGLTTIRRDIT
ncbi:MAG TPA: ABC transporter permease [Actinotalea sp.]|jgi:hypothetical protein